MLCHTYGSILSGMGHGYARILGNEGYVLPALIGTLQLAAYRIAQGEERLAQLPGARHWA